MTILLRESGLNVNWLVDFAPPENLDFAEFVLLVADGLGTDFKKCLIANLVALF